MVEAENFYNTQDMQSQFLDNQFTTEKIVENVAWMLRGFKWDSEKGEFTNKIIVDGKIKYLIPKVNEQGVMDICTELRARLINTYGHALLSINDLISIRTCVYEALWTLLCTYREEYELNVVNIKPILYIVDDQILCFLSRTKEGFFSKLLSKYIGRKETVTYQQQEEQPRKKIGGLF